MASLASALLWTALLTHETPAPPPPYSLPFALRPVAAGNVVRLDTVAALSDTGSTYPILLLASAKITPELALIARTGVIAANPEVGESELVVANVAFGALYGLKLSPELRLAPFLGLAVPIASGGGDRPEVSRRAAVLSGILARSAMDNALFATNYTTLFPGIGFAYVAGGLTLQAEATVLFLFRTRGDAMDKDESRINFTSGLHAGYFILPVLSAGAELRYQRWLRNETVSAVEDNPAADNLTVAAGPRLHFRLSETVWFRPAVTFAVGVDDPIGFGEKGSNYKLIQLDLPFAF